MKVTLYPQVEATLPTSVISCHAIQLRPISLTVQLTGSRFRNWSKDPQNRDLRSDLAGESAAAPRPSASSSDSSGIIRTTTNPAHSGPFAIPFSRGEKVAVVLPHSKNVF